VTGDRAAQFAVMLILPLSAPAVRRLPLTQALKMVLAWVAIFAVGLLITSQRDRLSDLKTLFTDQQISRTETRIRMAEDGHFWADVEIDGVRRRMLIDSGATTTALSTATAQAAGLDLNERPFATVINTANGAVTARTATVQRVTIGSVTATNLGIVSSPAFGDTDVVGMNFLSRLASWRVEGGTLILTPKPA